MNRNNDFIIIKSNFLSIIRLLVDNQEINQLDHMFVSFHISNLKIKFIYRPVNWRWKVNDKLLKILIDFFFFYNIYWYFFSHDYVFYFQIMIFQFWHLVDYFMILKFSIINLIYPFNNSIILYYIILIVII